MIVYQIIGQSVNLVTSQNTVRVLTKNIKIPSRNEGAVKAKTRFG